MKFLESLFSSRSKNTNTNTSTTANTAVVSKPVAPVTKAVSKTDLVNSYSGPIIGVFQDVQWYYHQSLLVEFSKASDLNDIPANMISAGQQGMGIGHFDGDSGAVTVSSSMKYWRGLEGGRSFRRPRWSSDLDACGAYIFPIDNTSQHHNLAWRIKHWSIVDAPILFVISNPEWKAPTGVVPPGEEAPKPPELLFAQCPTEKEFLEKMKLDAGIIGNHPIKIVFGRFEETAAPEAPVTKGKRKASALESSSAPALPTVKIPQEIKEGLRWLSEHIIVDSYSQRSLMLELKAEEERKKKLETEQQKVKESAPSVAPAAQPPTEPAALAA